MKKIVSLILSVILLLSVCITASAAGGATLNGNTSVTAGNNIEFIVSVSGCGDATSIAVAVTHSGNFELVSGTWLKTGSITKFDTSTEKGALGGLSSPDVNGNLFKVVLKAKTASASLQTVIVNVIAKNGSTEIMNISPSKSVRINCASHTYGGYTNANATHHVRTCTACGNTETQAHTWDGGVVTKAANCKEAGVKTYTCTTAGCGGTKTEAIAKTNNHTYGNWTQTKAPTCTVKGTESRTCSTCQNVETKDIAATGHKMGAWTQTKAPDCTNKGTEKSTCSECDEAITRDIPATGHKMGSWKTVKEPDCTNKGSEKSTCSVCDETVTRDIPAKGHKMGNWKTTKDATCEGKGEEARECSVCQTVEKRATNALGHKFANSTVVKQPTCTTTGLATGTCTRCNKQSSNVLKATGHNFKDWTVTKPATCTEVGVEEHKCAKCGAAETREVAALGHDFDNPVVVKEPTLTEKGIKEGVCKNCGEKTQSEIPCAFKDDSTGIAIETEEGVFEAGTEIMIEVISEEHSGFSTVKTALKEVASKFVAYDVLAVLNSAVVQPNGTVTVSFKIPEDFGKNVAVYYINDEGVAEKLESSISEDGTSISANLTHFSSYAVVDLDTVQTGIDASLLWIIIAAAAVVIIGGAVVTIVVIKKKKANQAA